MYIHNIQLSEVSGFVCHTVYRTCRGTTVRDAVSNVRNFVMLLAVVPSDVTVGLSYLWYLSIQAFPFILNSI
jgi:hypothetical protein